MGTTRAGVDAPGRDPDPGLAVLAEAGRVLGVSLDYRRTLQALSEVGLGAFSDACLVGLLDDAGRLRIVAGAHVDRSKRRIIDALWNAPITPCSHIAAVVRGGRARVLPAIDDQRLQAALDGDALALVRQLQLGPTMIVPLIVRGQRIGAVIFSRSAGDRVYDAADVTLAEELARRAAAAVDNARAFSHTSDVAHTLQQRLLPPRLPRIAGIELAARYQPAGQHVEVGGDFYDAFPLGEDRWGLLIGDVAGKGPSAAATTAVVRYTARAAARFGSRLGVAAAVNEALLEMEDGEGFCTMTYAELRLEPGRVVLAIVNCGHPAPLLVGPNGDIRELRCQGSLLGQFPDFEVGSLTVELRPGETVVFVTDGVLEARAPRREADDGTVELFDHVGLATTLAAGAGESATNVACRIQQAALAFSGGSLEDDLATLVLRVVERPRSRPRTRAQS
ncbi:MAG TPA: GAF domain-containing SpoIIE family protein phosphatase [Acidimicrobiia bacterium]|nr:GAF domain-containing SpoIIE family protein phosphatase [Acidimicrobiia bacterium]